MLRKRYIFYVFYVAFLSLLFVYARSEGERFPTFLFISCLTIFIIDFLTFYWAKSSSHLTVSIPQSSFEAHSSFSFDLHFKSSSLSLGQLFVRINLPEHWSTSDSLKLKIDSSKDSTHSLRILAEKRGLYKLGPIYGTLSDPLALFHKEICFYVSKNIYVTPKLLDHVDSTMIVSEQESSYGVLSHQGQPCSSARNYQYGDPLQRIHWKATAKAGKVMVKETELETTSTLVWIDLSHHSYKKDPDSLETAISLAATLLKHFNDNGRSVHVIATGSTLWNITFPTDNFGQVLEYLATAQSDGDDLAENVLFQLPRRKNIIIITSFLSSGMIKSLNRLYPSKFIVYTASPMQGTTPILSPFVEVRCILSA